MITTKPTAPQLTFRLYEPGDIDGILQLWKEESGWGEITAKQFNEWYIDTPYGSSLVVLIVNEEEKVMGQIMFTPTRMVVDGIELRSLRGSAPIISSALRQVSLRSLDHPALSLIKKGFEFAAEKGFQYVYSFPAYGWLGMLQLFPRFMPNPCETASYECFAISLDDPITLPVSDNEYYVIQASSFTSEYDELWEEAIEQMPVNCGIARQSKWLSYAAGPNLVLETRHRDDHHLTGYSIIKPDGLMVDIFARNWKDLNDVFNNTLNTLHYHNKIRIPVGFRQLKGMRTSYMDPILSHVPFTVDSYCFAFSGYLLDTSIPFEKVRSDSWYMTPFG